MVHWKGCSTADKKVGQWVGLRAAMVVKMVASMAYWKGSWLDVRKAD